MNRFSRAAFTLIETLNVVGVLAVASAIVVPLVKSAASAGNQFMASRALHDLSQATYLYMADAEDTFPLAARQANPGIEAWFGYAKKAGDVDVSKAVLKPYLGDTQVMDPTRRELPYLGDMSGFGYNWYALGSDASVTGQVEDFPNLENPARIDEIKEPNHTLAFATCAYANVSWRHSGDDLFYDYGFVSPPSLWRGVPDIDFRHGGGTPKVDEATHTVDSQGQALVLYADGKVKAVYQRQIQDKLFQR